MATESKSMSSLLFDRNFEKKAQRPPAKPVEIDMPPPPAFTEQQMAEARALGLDAGRVQGHAEAMAGIEARTAQALQQLALSMGQPLDQIEDIRARLTQESVQIAYMIAARLAPALIQRAPLAEIETLVAECLAAHQRTPRLVVRLNGDSLDPLQARLDDLIRSSGYEGRVVLLEDANLALGDCRIEWADGGVERDMKSLMDDIDAAVARFAATAHGAQGDTR